MISMQKKSIDADRQYTITESAELLGRKPATLRMWDREERLPVRLRPSKNDRGWRLWTGDQLIKIRDEWMPKHAIPGRGLAHYNPDPREAERKLQERRKREEEQDA
jgi:hypothetical protein